MKVKKILGISLAAVGLVTAGGFTAKTLLNNNVVENQSVIALKKSIVAEDKSDTLLIEADIKNGAYGNKLNWMVTWADGIDHGNVNDYINLSVAEDTHSAQVSVKKSFSNQIMINVSLKSNDSVSATCTVDYIRRTEDIYLYGTDTNYYDFASTWEDFERENIELDTREFIINSVGTVPSEQQLSYVVEFTHEVYQAIDDVFCSEYDVYSFYKLFQDRTSFNPGVEIKAWAAEILSSDETVLEKLYYVLSDYEEWFTITVNVKDVYSNNIVNEYSEVFTAGGIDLSEIIVNDFNLTDTELIF